MPHNRGNGSTEADSGSESSGDTVRIDLGLRNELAALREELAGIHHAIDESRQQIRKQEESLVEALPKQESWLKRWAVVFTLGAGISTSIVAWWIGNDRAMVRAAVEREYETKREDDRDRGFDGRLFNLEDRVEQGLGAVVARGHTQDLRVQRIETMLETLARKQQIEIPPPINIGDGSP